MKAGDKVTWTHVSQRGSSIVFRAWEGVLTEGNIDDSEHVTIKRFGKLYRVPRSVVRPIKDKNHLTEMVMGK